MAGSGRAGLSRGLALAGLAWGNPEPVPYHQALSLAQEHGWGDGGGRVDYGQENPVGSG